MIKLMTKEAVMDSTADYIDRMEQEGLTIKCINITDTGELRLSTRFQRMLRGDLADYVDSE